MRFRKIALVSALVAVPTAAAVVSGPLAGATATTWTTTRSARTPATRTAPTKPSPATTTRSANGRWAKGGTATLVGVKVTTTSDDWTSKETDAARRRTRRATCVTPGPGTSAYSLTGTRVNAPTTAYLNPSGAPAGAASAFQAAFNTWKAADANAPSITVSSGGTATSPQADHTYELMFGPLGGRTLAITYTWHWTTGEYESDTEFSTNVPWFLAGSEGSGCYNVAAYDLQNTATHEFGHIYGLGHVSSAFNTMAPTATLGETYKRSLASGDIAGIRAIY